MAKFKTENKARFGRNLILPVIQETSISEDGIIEVPKDSVVEFKMFDTAFVEVDEPKKPEVKTKVEEVKVEEPKKTSSTTSTNLDKVK